MDRATLDAAMEFGLDYGGSIPKGRKAEDGPVSEKYDKLTELSAADYRARTRRNVADSDATLILAKGGFDSGTALTARLASDQTKPCLVVDLAKQRETDGLVEAVAWLRRVKPRVLNVAGPRESKAHGIYETARGFLRLLFSTERPWDTG